MKINIQNKDNNNELKKEIKDIKSKNINLFNAYSSLKDLSHLKTYTIDDNDSLEIDDAISLERLDCINKLWIHIASPAFYIDFNSEIDKSARKLISTLYLSNKNIYMLPEILINEVFSLDKKQKRAALSLGVIFNKDGSVESYELVQSIIKPTYQLSYDDADDLIDYAPKEEEDLSIILKILQKRKAWRTKLGAKEILESYGKIVVKNNIPSIRIIYPTLSRILISEAMIVFGNLISIYTKKNNIPVPYRVQENKSTFLNNIESSRENIILKNFYLKKNMGKTNYSNIPLRHNSLGLNSYLHATSPIRRYSDLLVHYQIYRFLNNKVLISNEEIYNIIKLINNLEKKNTNIYREDQKVWQNKWFKNNSHSEYKIMFLNWINRYKNISIIYFIDFRFSAICYLKSKREIKVGDMLKIKNITNDYTDMLYFKNAKN